MAFMGLVRLVLFVSFWEETALWSGTEDHGSMDFLVSCAWPELLSCAERCKCLLNFGLMNPMFLFLPCLVLLMISQFHPFSWRP